MKKILILVFLMTVLKTNGQNYLITFSGSGASSLIQDVVVENLNKGTSLSLSGEDILRLNLVTGTNSDYEYKSENIDVYPNPSSGTVTIRFTPTVAGETVITIVDYAGRKTAAWVFDLERENQQFRLSGLDKGFYYINVRGRSYQYSAKILCTKQTDGIARLEKVDGTLQHIITAPDSGPRTIQAGIVDMDYSAGERLKLTGISGSYVMIITDVPVSDKTINFNFADCTDGDNNSYAAIQIGGQVWMGENLKTTKFSNGNDIPLVTSDAGWSALSSPGYCWMNNDPVANKNVYGALYNWYAVADARNICPTGWHVPADDEWNTLSRYAEGNDFASGGRLKEKGTLHWQSPNVGATDEYSFRALPGGSRYLTGAFDFYGDFGRWWTATQVTETTAWHQYISNQYPFVYRYNNPRENGYSVRCIKN